MLANGLIMRDRDWKPAHDNGIKCPVVGLLVCMLSNTKREARKVKVNFTDTNTIVLLLWRWKERRTCSVKTHFGIDTFSVKCVFDLEHRKSPSARGVASQTWLRWALVKKKTAKSSGVVSVRVLIRCLTGYNVSCSRPLVYTLWARLIVVFLPAWLQEQSFWIMFWFKQI